MGEGGRGHLVDGRGFGGGEGSPAPDTSSKWKGWIVGVGKGGSTSDRGDGGYRVLSTQSNGKVVKQIRQLHLNIKIGYVVFVTIKCVRHLGVSFLAHRLHDAPHREG